MTNRYPEFAYEQSWTAGCFSTIRDSCIRGTVTFCDGFCVGAVRNDRKRSVAGRRIPKAMLKGFPPAAAETLQQKTFPFLLLKGVFRPRPVISGAFWCDRDGVRFSPGAEADFAELFPGLFSLQRAVDWCRDIFELDEDSPVLKLAASLTRRKLEDPAAPILLTAEERACIPGEDICPECAESLAELRVFL